MLKLGYYDKNIETINCIDGILIIKNNITYKKIEIYNHKIYDITLNFEKFNNNELQYEYCIYHKNYNKYRQISFKQAKDYLVKKCDIPTTLFNSIFYEFYDQSNDEDTIFTYKGFTIIINQNCMDPSQIKSLIDQVEQLLPIHIFDKIKCYIEIIKGQTGGLKHKDNTIRLGNNSTDKLKTLMHEIGHLYSKYINKNKVNDLIDFIAFGEDEINLKKDDIIEIDYGLLSNKMKNIKVTLKVLQVKPHKFKAKFIPEEEGDEDSWYGDEYYDLITKINNKSINRRSISQYSKYDREEFIAEYFAGYFMNKIKDNEIKQKVKTWFE